MPKMHAADNLSQRMVGVGAQDLIGQIVIPAGGSGSSTIDRSCVSLILSNAGPDPVWLRWDVSGAAIDGMFLPPYAMWEIPVHAGEVASWRWECAAGEQAILCYAQVVAK